MNRTLICFIFFYLIVQFLPSSNCTSIQQYVDAAITKGYDYVIIPPGIYNTTNGINLQFEKKNNFKLYAYNVTLVSTIRARAIDFTGSTNISIYGLTVDYDPLTFTQGTIVDINNEYLDLKIHAGYPVVPWARIIVVDPKTRFMKDGMQFMWDITANITQPGIIRVYRTSKSGFYTAAIGDYGTLAGGSDGNYACHGIGVTQCSEISLIDVTLHAAPGFGLADYAGEEGMTIHNFQIVPGPMPMGATQERLQTTSWDGINHSSGRTGPVVYNSKVELAGDDTWSVTSAVYTIAEINAEQGQLVFGGSSPYLLEAGDTLHLRNELVYPEEYVTVVDVIGISNYPDIHSFYCASCAAKALRQDFVTPNFTVQVKETIPSNWNVSYSLYSPERQSRGWIFSDNYVRSKGRGALIKSPFGLLQNNYFEGGTTGVQVASEMSGVVGSEANVAYDLIIQNNTIVHVGYHETFNDSTYGANGAIALFQFNSTRYYTICRPSAMYNILIDGNTFSEVNGINIGITSTNGVTVSNNYFYNTFPVQYGGQGTAFGFKNGYTVFITETNNITLEGNIAYGKGPYEMATLYVSPTVSDIIGEQGGITQLNNTFKH